MAQVDRSHREEARWPGLLRPVGVHSDEVQPIELFFDLVYVLAVTQMTHYLLEHQSWRGTLQTLAILLGVWAGWINVVWITNYFDVGARAVRIALLAGMFVGLVMSSSVEDAYGHRGLAFAVPVSTIMIISPLLGTLAVGRNHPLRPTLDRVVVWWVALGVLWITGALFHHDLRLWLWLIAGVATLVVVYLGFPIPRYGHNLTSDYTIAGGHIAERCLLFIILALGESILITGGQFGELPHDRSTWLAFSVAFVGSVAMWWIYFDRAEEGAREQIADSDDPGRLGVIVYTFWHIPLVAGIIVSAAADEISIAHPTHHVDTAAAFLILGGPALFLLGHLLVKRSAFGILSFPRLIGLLLIAALVPVAEHLTNLQLAAFSTASLLMVTILDYHYERTHPGHFHQNR